MQESMIRTVSPSEPVRKKFDNTTKNLLNVQKMQIFRQEFAYKNRGSQGTVSHIDSDQNLLRLCGFQGCHRY